jgi:hypothetical protein
VILRIHRIGKIFCLNTSGIASMIINSMNRPHVLRSRWGTLEIFRIPFRCVDWSGTLRDGNQIIMNRNTNGSRCYWRCYICVQNVGSARPAARTDSDDCFSWATITPSCALVRVMVRRSPWFKPPRTLNQRGWDDAGELDIAARSHGISWDVGARRGLPTRCMALNVNNSSKRHIQPRTNLRGK